MGRVLYRGLDKGRDGHRRDDDVTTSSVDPLDPVRPFRYLGRVRDKLYVGQTRYSGPPTTKDELPCLSTYVKGCSEN